MSESVRERKAVARLTVSDQRTTNNQRTNERTTNEQRPSIAISLVLRTKHHTTSCGTCRSVARGKSRHVTSRHATSLLDVGVGRAQLQFNVSECGVRVVVCHIETSNADGGERSGWCGCRRSRGAWITGNSRATAAVVLDVHAVS